MLPDIAVAVGAAFATSLIACGLLIRVAPVDVPSSARAAHKAPTPTSGGIGVVLGFLVGLAVLDAFSAASEVGPVGAAYVRVCAAFAGAFLILGFIDDAQPIDARIKFVLFAALSAGAAYAVGIVDTLPLGGGVVLQLGLAGGLFGTSLWIFTLVNCVNFMDGANGLAIGSIAIALLGLGAIAATGGAPGAAAMSFSGAAAMTGFLIWNFPRGRMFAGDSGALFAGALGAMASLVVIWRIGLSPFVPPIIFFPLLADALLTLADRALKRRSLLEGHSEHIYQIAMRAGWSHAQIALAFWALTAGSALLGVAVAPHSDSALPWMTLAAMAALAVAVSIPIRAAARKRGIEEV